MNRTTQRVLVFAAGTLVAAATLTALPATQYAPAPSASATHPVVTGSATCNLNTGDWDTTWKVQGDPSYPAETATIVSQSRATSPTLVGLSVQNTSSVTGSEVITTAGSYTQHVGVQWTNHAAGDIVYADGSVNITGVCIPRDASATKVETQETCYADSVVTLNLVFASVDPAYLPLPTSVGSHTVPVIADAGHQFANGTANDTVDYTIVAADPSLCPQDASATKVVTAETCYADSVVTLTLVNADIDPAYGPMPTAPGTYTVPVIAKPQHLFANGTDKDTVTFTIVAADPSLCPQDASAVDATAAATCYADSVPNITLVFASVDAGSLPLPTSVGSHTVPVTADLHHLFANGTSHDTVTYIIVAADPSLCPHDASWTKSEQKEDCFVRSTASITVTNGYIDPAFLPLPTGVGTWNIPVIANQYHLFANGTMNDVVTYTIKAKQTEADGCPAILALTGDRDPRPILVGDGLGIITVLLFLIPWTRKHWMLPAVRWIATPIRRLYRKVVAAVKTA